MRKQITHPAPERPILSIGAPWVVSFLSLTAESSFGGEPSTTIPVPALRRPRPIALLLSPRTIIIAAGHFINARPLDASVLGRPSSKPLVSGLFFALRLVSPACQPCLCVSSSRATHHQRLGLLHSALPKRIGAWSTPVNTLAPTVFLFLLASPSPRQQSTCHRTVHPHFRRPPRRDLVAILRDQVNPSTRRHSLKPTPDVCACDSAPSSPVDIHTVDSRLWKARR